MMQLRSWGISEIGLTRQHNEDHFEIDPERGLYLVADGMGGHSHGEVASRTAAQAIRSFIGDRGPGEGLSSLLHRAVQAAHQRVLGAIRGNVSLSGMGTTVVALLAEDRTATIAHVGDSRAYRLRDRRLELLTEDHTWVHEQVLAGFLSEQQARLHPLKNVVTRALGSDGEVQIDLQELELKAGDRYLLCSDGLTTMLEDEQIARRVQEQDSVETTCRRLVDDAKACGGFDDITVVVVEVVEDRG